MAIPSCGIGRVHLTMLKVRNPFDMQIVTSVRNDTDKLQGTWKQIACNIDGVPNASEELGPEPRVTFSGSEYVVTASDGRVAIKGTFRLDPAQTPKAVDWIDTFGADAGERIPAIYKIENETFVFCASANSQARPKDFNPGPGRIVRIHRRD
jgi:uncharacterized protein (TIGR03067 family)